MDEERRQMALRHYAIHLYESMEWDELFALVRRDGVVKSQRQYCPNEPDLPIVGAELALRAAVEKQDPSAIAEFLLKRARRSFEVAQENPLSAARNHLLSRAWSLADDNEPTKRMLWHLLIAWEYWDVGMRDYAHATLERLLPIEVQPFVDGRDQWKIALTAYLLARTAVIDGAAFRALYPRLFPVQAVRSFDLLLSHLVIAGQCDLAADVARSQPDERAQARALLVVVLETAKRGDPVSALALAPDLNLFIDTGVRRDAARVMAAIHIEADNLDQGFELACAARADDLQAAIVQAHLRVGALSVAIEAARSIEYLETCAQQLVAVGAAYAQAGDRAMAIDTFVEARTIIEKITYGDLIVRALASLAAAQRDAGLRREAARALLDARNIIRQMRFGDGRAGRLALFAQVQAELGHTSRAENIISTAIDACQQIDFSLDRERALRHIAELCLDRGILAGLHRTLLQLNLGYDIIDEGFVDQIVALYIEHRDYTAARELARPRLATDRLRILITITQAAISAEDHAEARIVMSELLADVLRLDQDREPYLVEIGALQALLGDIAAARATFAHVLQPPAPIEDLFESYTLALTDVFAAQWQAGERVAAHATIQEALYGGAQVGSAVGASRALAAIAAAQIERGFCTVEPEELLDRIIEAEDRVMPRCERIEATIRAHLTDNGAQSTRVGEAIHRWPLPLVTALASLKPAFASKQERIIDAAVLALADRLLTVDAFDAAYAMLGEIDSTIERSRAGLFLTLNCIGRDDLDQALGIAANIPQQPYRDEALAIISASHMRSGQIEQARVCAHRCSSPAWHALGLAAGAWLLDEQGTVDLARQYFVEARSHVEQINTAEAVAAMLVIQLLQWMSGDEAGYQETEIALSQIDVVDLDAEQLMTFHTVVNTLFGAGDSALAEIRRVNVMPDMSMVAQALAECWNRPTFATMLVNYRFQPGTAYRLIGLLARLYPQDAIKIAATLNTELTWLTEMQAYSSSTERINTIAVTFRREEFVQPSLLHYLGRATAFWRWLVLKHHVLEIYRLVAS